LAGLGCSQYAASPVLTDELAWCPFSERSVRTTLIVFLPPCFDQPLRLGQRPEPVSIQALGSEGSVERFHEGIVGRLAWAGEVDLHTVLVGPQVHGLTGELAAVVAEQDLRHVAMATLKDQSPFSTRQSKFRDAACQRSHNFFLHPKVVQPGCFSTSGHSGSFNRHKWCP
jgi:hypothetical protein